MSESNFREYLKTSLVKSKKYFYVLRPVLACLWIEKNQTPPPIEFDILLQDCSEIKGELKTEILKLLERKKR
jgi:predicted nucleotidyltransferase